MVLSHLLHPLPLLSPLFHLICETGLVFGRTSFGCFGRKGDEICQIQGEEWDRDRKGTFCRVQACSNLQDMEQCLLMFCEIK